MGENILTQLQGIVGSQYASNDEFDLHAYSNDWGYDGPKLADYIVTPGCTEEVSEVMKLANSSNTPVTLRGGGTTTTGSSLPRQRGIVLDINRMNTIYGIDEDAMTVTMDAGTTVYEAITYIEKRGWKVPPKPKFGSGVSVAGWASFNGVGAGGCVNGRVTDFVAGMEVVLPTGEIVNTGSRTMKGVTQQFCRYQGTGCDLTGLFMNTFGTMGVMTKITWALYRKPEALGIVGYGFDTPEDMQAGVRVLKEARICYGINLYDDEIADICGLPKTAPWVVHQFSEGYQEEVDFRVKKGKELMAKSGIKTCREIEAIPFWWGVEGMTSRLQPSMRTICVGGFHSIGTTAAVMHAYNDVGRKHNLRRGMVWWVINHYANVFPIYVYNDETELDVVIQAAADLREAWCQIGCTPDFPGPNPDATPWITPEYLAFYKKVKMALDPNHIMHRGMSPIVEY